MRIRKTNVAVALAGALAIAGALTVSVRAQDAVPVDGPGKDELVTACGGCHTTEIITAKHRTPDDWTEVMDRMAGLGATLNYDQYKTVTTYLNTYYGKQNTAAAGTASTPAPAKAASAH